MESGGHKFFIPKNQFRSINLNERLQSVGMKRNVTRGKLTDQELYELFSGRKNSSYVPKDENVQVLGPKIPEKEKNKKKRRKKYITSKISDAARKRILDVLQDRKKKREEKSKTLKTETTDPAKVLSTEEISKVIARSKTSLLDGMRLFSNLEILVWKIDSILNGEDFQRNRAIHKPNYFRIHDQNTIPLSLLSSRFQRPAQR